MLHDLESIAWSAPQLGRAVLSLLRSAGLANTDAVSLNIAGDNGSVANALEAHAAAFGCEAVPIQSTFAELAASLRRIAPGIIQVDANTFLAVSKATGSTLTVLTPSGSRKQLLLASVVASLRAPVQTARSDSYRQLLTSTGLHPARIERALSVLLDQHFGLHTFHNGWHFRRPVAGATLWEFLGQSGVLRRSAWLVAAHVAEYAVWLAAWALMGRLSLEGRMDLGWLTGWALLLLTTVPLRIGTTWLQGALAIGLGSHLKRRLLAGALQLDPQSLRHLGIGAFLGQALEAEAVETLALSGGVVGLLACIELLISGAVLGTLSILLAIWCAVLAFCAWKFFVRYERWTTSRMSMTGNLVENLSGHRTRVAQAPPELWHEGEDAALASYYETSRAVDSTGMWLVSAIPRGWLTAGMLWLVPAAMSGASGGTHLAVQLGGVLLAYTAFKKLTAASVDIAAAFVATRRIAPLFQATANSRTAEQPLANPLPHTHAGKILEADRVTFRYSRTGNLALHPASLSVHHGDKILLEGSSGGGKTTFASLLCGMRKPQSGSLLLHGLDHHTIGGAHWRQRVAAAPQFHENYLLTETLAFNLLFSRQWPPSRQDLEEAARLCHALGLGDLLDRMPGGLEQMVGEGGWQLSHGERSRVYMARALLQRADVVILDESFGALDPETLEQSLQCTLAWVPTLLVIAHP